MRFERLQEMFSVTGALHSDAAFESTSVLGRLLFLRMISQCMKGCGGSLARVPSLMRENPDVEHLLKQTTSLVVIEKIVRSTINRPLTEGLEAGNSYLEQGKHIQALWKFMATAELALVVLDFEQNPWFQQRWKKPVSGGLALYFSLLLGASRAREKMGDADEADKLKEIVENDPRYRQLILKRGTLET